MSSRRLAPFLESPVGAVRDVTLLLPAAGREQLARELDGLLADGDQRDMDTSASVDLSRTRPGSAARR
jgi:hypothetical protein